MLHHDFHPVPLDNSLLDQSPPSASWLWHGYVARGNLTLLTSVWKAGKTTLITGLLRHLATGGQFLGHPCDPARVLIVSEESKEHWAARIQKMPVGPHAHVLARPFHTRPSAESWESLIDFGLELRQAGNHDLFIVDPLAPFLPNRGENDAGSLLELLQPLHRLASAGVAVLLLHHPRRKKSVEGNSARGSGALLGFVDVILELNRLGTSENESNRRRLVGLSRNSETPRRLEYELNSGTGEFMLMCNSPAKRFEENWPILLKVMQTRNAPGTYQDLTLEWPPDLEKPIATTVYEWLIEAGKQKLVRREGKGRKNDPFRYRLPNEDDQYRDRGEIPPLKPLFGLR